MFLLLLKEHANTLFYIIAFQGEKENEKPSALLHLVLPYVSFNTPSFIVRARLL